MKLSIDDIKEIVNKVTQGGCNYTPLEYELARMCLKYRQRIGQIAAEKAEMSTPCTAYTPRSTRQSSRTDCGRSTRRYLPETARHCSKKRSNSTRNSRN